ncbi:Hypothetical protein (Fragment), partial [Durusdinium trenchii]
MQDADPVFMNVTVPELPAVDGNTPQFRVPSAAKMQALVDKERDRVLPLGTVLPSVNAQGEIIESDLPAGAGPSGAPEEGGVDTVLVLGSGALGLVAVLGAAALVIWARKNRNKAAGGKGLQTTGKAGAMSGLRRLWARPGLAAEWDQEYEDRSAAWWELFLDLLFVAAASNVADTFKEDMTLHGAFGFVVTFSLFFAGWTWYTVFSSRYVDASLSHSVLLFVYLLGVAGMVVNASGDEALHG